MDVSTLSDAELREALVARGVNVGPIQPSTRNIYIKKLASMIDIGAEDTASTRLSPPRVAAETVAEPVPPPEEVFQTPIQREESSAPVVENDDEDEENSDAEDYEGEESMRILSDAEMRASNVSFKTTKQAAGFGTGTKVVLSVFSVITAVVLFYLFESLKV